MYAAPTSSWLKGMGPLSSLYSSSGCCDILQRDVWIKRLSKSKKRIEKKKMRRGAPLSLSFFIAPRAVTRSYSDPKNYAIVAMVTLTFSFLPTQCTDADNGLPSRLACHSSAYTDFL
jgi:hypothetical protein